MADQDDPRSTPRPYRPQHDTIPEDQPQAPLPEPSRPSRRPPPRPGERRIISPTPPEGTPIVLDRHDHHAPIRRGIASLADALLLRIGEA